MQALASDTRARGRFSRVARTTLRRNKLRSPTPRSNQKSSGSGADADRGSDFLVQRAALHTPSSFWNCLAISG